MQILQLQYKPEKNSGFNGIWTHDLCVASVMLNNIVSLYTRDSE